MHFDVELDRTIALARETDAVHGEELLRPLEGIDEANQLQVVPGKIAFDFHRGNSGVGRVFLLVFGLHDSHAVCGATLVAQAFYFPLLLASGTYTAVIVADTPVPPFMSAALSDASCAP